MRFGSWALHQLFFIVSSATNQPHSLLPVINNSNSNHSGALSWTVEADGSFPLKSIVATATGNFSTMRSELDAELAAMTLTPLQSVQYDLLKDWVDEGTVGWMAIRAIPSGGIVETRETGVSYYTLGMSLYVRKPSCICLYNLTNRSSHFFCFGQHAFSRGSVVCTLSCSAITRIPLGLLCSIQHINSTVPSASAVIDPNFLQFDWGKSLFLHPQRFNPILMLDITVDRDALLNGLVFTRQMAAASPLVDLLEAANGPDASIQTTDDFNTFLAAHLSVRSLYTQR